MSVKERFNVYGYFIIINSLISILISCRYFSYMPEFPKDTTGILFIILSAFSHMVLLTAICSVIMIPLLFLPKTIRKTSIALFATLAITILFIDTIVFSQYRFHMNAVVLKLLSSGQIVSFPLKTWLMLICAISIIFILQFGLVTFLEKQLYQINQKKLGRKFTYLVILSLLTSNLIHIWGAAYAYQPVTQVKRYLPLFYPVTSNTLMTKLNWIDQDALEKQKLLTMNNQGDLNYPLKPLITEDVKKPTNIIFLVVDSWRADTFNAENTPNMWKFSQSGLILNQHISAGNATRVALFGMYYAIPGTYWHSVIDNKKSPVFLDRLQALNYQMGIFASAQLKNPEFDQTVFLKIPNLRKESKGTTVIDRDTNITNEWLSWFEQRDKNTPSFSFLFYDAPHSYDFPKNYTHQYKPMLNEVNYLELDNNTNPTLLMNRYKTSVHFVDSLAGKILDKLSASGELENTVIIITGDHGQEINDNHLNYWGHNSNFSDSQVHVPFAIIGKGIEPKNINWGQKFTSHYDIVPTLMKNYLGVKNDFSDYSTGINLLDKPLDRSWLLTSSYSKYAVVTHQDIMEVGSAGQFQYIDKKYQTLKQEPNYSLLQQALEHISRFSK